MLYRVALRLMGQREEAEDILQETLLHVRERLETFLRDPLQRPS
jgi:DNA-directed RNA polymerase specialized sigma24 family protein